MDIKKKTRTELKEFFKANDKPTEKQFADFIDAGINQAEDSIVKEQGSPLAIQAEGDEVGTQEVLDLYTSFAKNSPNWSINLNPRVKSEDPNSNQSGLNIKDTTGQSRLFIKSGDGSIGVGTIDPVSKLTIQGKNNRSSLAVIDTTKQNAKIFEITQKDGDGVLSLRGGNTEEGIHLSGSKEKPSFFLGKVGIGTSSPDANLHVFGEKAILKVTNTNAAGAVKLGLYNNEKSWEIEADNTSGYLSFYPDGKKNNRIVMMTNESLFINSLLKVEGNVELKKKLYVGDRLTANSLVVFEKDLTIKGRIKTSINQVIAFSVSLSVHTKGAKNPLNFGQVNYNMGDHFKDNNHFIAPVKGMYLFTMCMRHNTDDGDVGWRLRLNNTGFVNGGGSTGGENSERSWLIAKTKLHMNSRTVITFLKAGDKVHVDQFGSGGNDNYSSGFEGILLQALT